MGPGPTFYIWGFAFDFWTYIWGFVPAQRRCTETLNHCVFLIKCCASTKYTSSNISSIVTRHSWNAVKIRTFSQAHCETYLSCLLVGCYSLTYSPKKVASGRFRCLVSFGTWRNYINYNCIYQYQNSPQRRRKLTHNTINTVMLLDILANLLFTVLSPDGIIDLLFGLVRV